jgi:transcriptional regulator with XRE-family HTH domain
MAMRQLRIERGISQEGLANLSSLHRTYVGGIERGERNPTLASLETIADALEVSTSELLALAERFDG